MVGRYAHRALDLLILLFAGLGFFYVPLGNHTGFEHARAIVSTGASTRALAELTLAFERVRSRVLGAGEGSEPKPEPPRFGRGDRARERTVNLKARRAGARATDLPDASAAN